MIRAVAIFACAAFFYCIAVPLGCRSAGGIQANAKMIEEVPDTCPITKPPQQLFTPPAPYTSGGQVWIGSAKLWTEIPRHGIWRGLSQKVFWWSEGYDWRRENPPELTITGKRLDGPAPHLRTEAHANAGWTNDTDHAFMVAVISIPMPGC